MLNRNKQAFLLILIMICHSSSYGQADSTLIENTQSGKAYTKSIVTDPFLPLFSSFALVYERIYNENNGSILGFWYGKETTTYPRKIKYPGYASNYALIIGYRRYFWRNLHAEYQLYPGYTRLYEENEDKQYQSFSLFPGIRILKYYAKIFAAGLLKPSHRAFRLYPQRGLQKHH